MLAFFTMIFCGILASNAQAAFDGGDGSADNPYLVATQEQLSDVRNHLDKHFKQTTDINLSTAGTGWEPIGSRSTPFTGSYDGDGYNINNLYINRFDTDYVGLFGYTGENSSILNVTLTGVDITTDGEAGGLAGRNYGLIDKCNIAGTVTGLGFEPLGGLIGDNQGTITNCSFDGVVNNSDDYTGGLIGWNEGTIEQCFAAGAVTGDDEVGGLVGISLGTITECGASADVTGTSMVGGLIGDSDGPIYNSYATGNVIGTQTGALDTMVGGLVGLNYKSINNCFSTGSVSGEDAVGGLVGTNINGTVTNSFWDSDTSNQAISAGGTKKTTSKMLLVETYTSWNFLTIWAINGSDNGGYPFLRWQGYHSGFSGGDGSESNPYLISTAEQLDNIRNHHNQHFKLIADIDLSAYLSFVPIGIPSFPYSGTFDGDGHKIKNLFINSSEDYAGLFKKIGTNGKIINLGLTGVDITGEDYCGGLAGDNSGLVENCYVTGVLEGSVYTGGLIGNNRGTISASYFHGTAKGYNYIGGLIGRNSGPIIDSHTEGRVQGNSSVGGLIGYNYKYSGYNCEVKDSYSIADVDGEAYDIGGLVGENEGKIEKSYARGPVKGYADIGGLVGNNHGEITKSYYRNYTVAGVTAEFDYVGGLVGDNTGIISQSFAKGPVTGREVVGGLVGYNLDIGNDGIGQISNCYAISLVTGNKTIGGLVGINEGGISDSYSSGTVHGSAWVGGLAGANLFDGIIDTSYWNADTAGFDATVLLGIPKTDNGMKSPSTYLGWDFVTIWTKDYIENTINNGYPFFMWESEQNLPPVLNADQASGITSTGATLKFTAFKTGTYYYLVYTAADAAPDAAAVKAQGAAIAKGTDTATAAVNTVNLTGLNASTAYKAYIIVEDANQNVTNIAQVSFTTEAAGANPTIDSITAVSNIQVAYGTNEQGAIDALPLLTTITDSDSRSHVVSLIWNIQGYNGSNAGDYPAVATFSLPTGVDQSDPATTLMVTATVTVSAFIPSSNADLSGLTLSAGTLDPVFDPNTLNYSARTEYSVSSITLTPITADINAQVKANDLAVVSAQASPDLDLNVGSNTITVEVTAPDSSVTKTYTITITRAEPPGGHSSGHSSRPPAPIVNANFTAGAQEERLTVTVDNSNKTASVILAENTIITAFGSSATGNVGVRNAIIEIPEILGVNSYVLELPADILASEEEDRNITMESKAGTITLPGNMLQGMGLEDRSNVGISLGEADKSTLPQEVQDIIGHRPVVEMKLTVGDAAIEWNNPNAPVTVSMPYTPTAEELTDPEHIVVWYIDGSGSVISVPTGRYDPLTGRVTFSTTHFSRYAIAYVYKSFDDLNSAEWARKSIEVMASKGIVNGTGANTYSPDTNITRADYLVLLIKTLGLTADYDSVFDDVNPNDYFYEALGIAKKLGITAGSGNNRFEPQANISRQDMMVLTARALEKYRGMIAAQDNSVLDNFSDRGVISDYATGCVASLVEEGLITGSGDKLNPNSETSRAEAAVFLYRIYNKF